MKVNLAVDWTSAYTWVSNYSASQKHMLIYCDPITSNSWSVSEVCSWSARLLFAVKSPSMMITSIFVITTTNIVIFKCSSWTWYFCTHTLSPDFKLLWRMSLLGQIWYCLNMNYFCRWCHSFERCQRFSAYIMADLHYMCGILCCRFSIHQPWPVSRLLITIIIILTIITKIIMMRNITII